MSSRETGWNIIGNTYIALRKGLMAVLVLLIRGYQLFISPYFPSSCRYYPTCSCYAIDAVKIHGPLKGTLLAAWRVLRCNPYTKGGEDPVPERKAEDAGHTGHTRHTVHSGHVGHHEYHGHAGHHEYHGHTVHSGHAGHHEYHGHAGHSGHHCLENTIHSNTNRHHF